MFYLKTDLSQAAREVSATGKASFAAVGDAIAQGIWEEFEVLVYDTAQWTGTTAASWNLSLGGGRIAIRRIGSKKTPLHRGHSTAPEKALDANRYVLPEIATVAIPTKGRITNMPIVIENYARGAYTAEHGPLRLVNIKGLEALERFRSRLQNKVFRPLIN